MTESIPFLPGLSPVGGKELCARFDGGRLSSDGGVLLLREVERGLGLAGLLASCLRDDRDPASITHTQAEMIRARMFAIACGYEDCDDLDSLRFDPAFKLACGRLSETGADLMSQPTLSRLENAPSWRELARMGLSLIDLFCGSFKQVPARIVLEPVGRNTAPAAAIAALMLEKIAGDALMLIAPADHAVADGEGLRAAIEAAR
ncbi:MAG: transposase, partial [Rhodospirillales bacterium]|nr:transposase [Rhodospirillales bacterium]